MHPWLDMLTEWTVTGINLVALLVILVGTLEALIDGFRVVATHKSEHDRRDVWMRYARWLIAGLTFQLAADILETSIHRDWVSIGQLGAIAVIRTFLSIFLDRDFERVRERQIESDRAARTRASGTEVHLVEGQRS